MSIEEILAEIGCGIDLLDGAKNKLERIRLQLKDTGDLEKLNALREELNNLLVKMEDEYM